MSSHVPITERSFDFYDEDGWIFQLDDARYPNWWMVDRFYEPGGVQRASPPTVARFRYLAGRRGGVVPGMTAKILTPTYNQIYCRLIVQWSRNWQGHQSGSNALCWFSLRNIPILWIEAHGRAYADLKPRIGLQSLTNQLFLTNQEQQGGIAEDGTIRLAATDNQDTVLPRGEWISIELIATCNSAGNEDGWFQLYVNNVKTHDMTGVKFVESADSHLWQRITILPVWGGPGDTLAQTQYLDIDHLYASGDNV